MCLAEQQGALSHPSPLRKDAGVVGTLKGCAEMSFLMLLHHYEVWDEKDYFAHLYLGVSLTLRVMFTRPEFCSGVGSLGAPVLGEQDHSWLQ